MSELERAIREHAEGSFASFHMPGHKGRRPDGVLPYELYGFDVTELPFSDELFEADGAIARLEADASRLFGSGATLISPFGATSCIQVMTAIAAAKGKLLIPRNSHYSVFNAVGLCGAEAVLLTPEPGGATPAGVVSPEAAEAAFRADGGISAMFLTSVDYYGYVADVAAFAEICRKYNKLLLVDNSHGAHLRFVEGFRHPLECGADIVTDSIHKTLPAMTGSALLHFADPALAAEGKKLMKRFCSSSPSYPIMLSIAAALGWAKDEGEKAYNTLAERLGRLKKDIEDYGYSVMRGEPCRLYVTGGSTGLSGAEISSRLARFGCVPEFADESGALLMFSPMNTEEELSRLTGVFIGAERKNAVLPKPARRDIIPRRAMSVADAFRAECECVPAAESAGRIAAECVGVYPPGLPAVITGEYIETLPEGLNMKRILVVKE